MAESIGVLVGRLRTAKNETQQELADALGVSRELVKFWEADQRQIKVELLRSLAEHFHVSADYLIGLSSDPSRNPAAVDELNLSPNAVEQLALRRNASNEETAVSDHLIGSLFFWRIVDDIAKLKQFSDPKNNRGDEELVLKAKHTAEMSFRRNAGGAPGAMVCGDDYERFLRFEIERELREFIDRELEGRNN